MTDSSLCLPLLKAKLFLTTNRYIFFCKMISSQIVLSYLPSCIEPAIVLSMLSSRPYFAIVCALFNWRQIRAGFLYLLISVVYSMLKYVHSYAYSDTVGFTTCHFHSGQYFVHFTVS